jgi:hypothetical protein
VGHGGQCMSIRDTNSRHPKYESESCNDVVFLLIFCCYEMCNLLKRDKMFTQYSRTSIQATELKHKNYKTAIKLGLRNVKSKSKLLYDWWSVSQHVLVSCPLWNLWPDITSCLKVAVLFLRGVLSDERTGLHFAVQSLNGPGRVEPISMLYISQEQGGPVIPPGTGFPLRRLLRLAGLGWRYSNLHT